METKLTLQEMHERIHALRLAVPSNTAHSVPSIFRLVKAPNRDWRAAWDGAPFGHGDTAQAAIDLAFRLAVDHYKRMGAVT